MDSDLIKLTRELEYKEKQCAENDNAVANAFNDAQEYQRAFQRKLLVLRAQRRILDAELENARAFLAEHPSKKHGFNDTCAKSQR